METYIPIIVLTIGLGLAALAVFLLVKGKGAITSLAIGTISSIVGIFRMFTGAESGIILIVGVVFILAGLIATRIESSNSTQTHHNRHSILDIANGTGGN